MRIGKREMTALLADTLGVSHVEANNIYDAFVEHVAEALVGGSEVSIKGVGVLSVSKQAASVRRNPQTGDAVNVPEKKRLKFTASGNIKEKLNAT